MYSLSITRFSTYDLERRCLLDLLEVAQRAWNGPRMKENEWRMQLFHKVQELVKRYDIQEEDPNDRSQVLAKDNAMIDSAWQAGIDFLVENGVYCYDTQRVITFTEREIRETLRAMPTEVLMGEGKDTVIARKRHMNGDKSDILACGGFHSPYREDIAHLAPRAFMVIPGVDYMQGFTLIEIDGREVHGKAITAYAARRVIEYMRQGARKAGRPGMPICLYPMSLQTASMVAPLDPRYGLRPCDGAMMTPLPEIEVEADLITTAIIYREYGLSFAQNGNGHGERDQFAGSRAGFIVTGIAKSIAGWLIYRCNITNMSPNIVHQAFHRHTNMIRVHGAKIPDMITRDHHLGSTRYALYYACYGINCASFGSAMEPSGGGRLEGTSPYEIEFMIECADASRGLSIEDGIELIHNIKTIADKECPPVELEVIKGYNGIPTGWNGSLPTIRNVYDLVMMKPSDDYVKEMKKARKIVHDSGLAIN